MVTGGYKDELRKAQDRLRRAQADQAELYARLYGVGFMRQWGKTEARARTYTNRGSNLGYTEDKTYTTQRTTRNEGQMADEKTRADTEIRAELVRIIQGTLRKLVSSRKDWMKIMLKMHRDVGELIESYADVIGE